MHTGHTICDLDAVTEKWRYLDLNASSENFVRMVCKIRRSISLVMLPYQPFECHRTGKHHIVECLDSKSYTTRCCLSGSRMYLFYSLDGAMLVRDLSFQVSTSQSMIIMGPNARYWFCILHLISFSSGLVLSQSKVSS